MNYSKFNLSLVGIIFMAIVLYGCTKHKTNENYQCIIEDRIRVKMLDNPDSAMEYVNIAVKADSISYEHGDYLHAFYYYQIKQDFKTAEKILEKLNAYFTDHEIEGPEEDSLYTDVLLLTTKNHLILGNYSKAMHYAKKASKVCKSKEDGTKYIAAEMDCVTGYVMCLTGEKEKGMKIINDAISFVKGVNKITAFHSYINCLSRKIAIMQGMDSCNCIIAICDEAMREIEDVTSNTDIEEIFLTEKDVNDFKQFYFGVFTAYKCAALAKLGEIDSTKALLNRCLDTEWGKLHEYTSPSLICAYAKLGMEEKLDSAYNRFIEASEGDTIQRKLLTLLENKAILAKGKNNILLALHYTEKSKEIQKQIFDKELTDQIIENAIVFEEEQKEKGLAELRKTEKVIWITHSIILSFVIILLVHWYYHRKKEKQLKAAYYSLLEKQAIIDTKNKLVSSINDIEKSDEDLPAIILFKRILDEMKNSKPYLKENFTINKMAELLGTNVNYVSHAISYGSHKTFPHWLAEYRNQIAIKALQENPNLSLNDICLLTGHNTRETFSRQFKTINGISFTEFKQQITKSKND
ncbi:MAG: AraC family transcriptional regulator [Paludibacteraceae bacterium]|nr:AraC family transcriptional regulator [Paludibacteraceae bacterium]